MGGIAFHIRRQAQRLGLRTHRLGRATNRLLPHPSRRPPTPNPEITNPRAMRDRHRGKYRAFADCAGANGCLPLRRAEPSRRPRLRTWPRFGFDCGTGRGEPIRLYRPRCGTGDLRPGVNSPTPPTCCRPTARSCRSCRSYAAECRSSSTVVRRRRDDRRPPPPASNRRSGHERPAPRHPAIA